MALIKCDECSEEVSEKAVACPKCGNPINERDIFDLIDKDYENLTFKERVFGKKGWGLPGQLFLE
jgi:peptide subunit release factor 1 (eRF1)